MDAHPLSFFLSFHTLIALVHPLHGNPYSLTLISIDGHLHRLLIHLVDVRLSSPFSSSPQPPFYSTYSAMSMAHAHVLHHGSRSHILTKQSCLLKITWPKFIPTKSYSLLMFHFRHTRMLSSCTTPMTSQAIVSYFSNLKPINFHAIYSVTIHHPGCQYYFLVISYVFYFAFILLCIFITKLSKILSYHIYQISLS